MIRKTVLRAALALLAASAAYSALPAKAATDLAEGHEIPAEERVLMDRALAENAVIVAQMEPLYGDEDDGEDDGDED